MKKLFPHSKEEDSPDVIELRNQGGVAAIIFIHGFTGDRTTTWGPLPEFIRSDPALCKWDIYSVGYSSRLSPDIVGVWSADAPIERLAGLFRTTMRFGISQYGALALVAHSMGGLVVQRALLDDPGLRARVSHVFLFGTPSAGLRKAAPFGIVKRQLGDMAFGSPFISALRQQWDATVGHAMPFTLWAIAGERDEFVTTDSSIEPFDPSVRAVVPGNHLEMVKPSTTGDVAFLLIKNQLLGKAAPAGPWNSARVAVETRRYFEAIQLLEPQVALLDEGGLVMLALAYDGVGRTADAMRVLETHGEDKLDAMGTLAGRFKRRWIAERRKADLDRAMELYGTGFRVAQAERIPDQVYYHGINLAFLYLATDALQSARIHAELALTSAAQGVNRKWSEATAGEAELILGHSDSGLVHYRRALEFNPSMREIEATYRQAMWIAELLNDSILASELRRLFRSEGVES